MTYPRTPEQREHRRRYQAAWNKANPDKVREKRNAWKKRNKAQVAAADRAYSKANPAKIRARHLRRNYGMTIAQWDAMFAAQGSRCAVCCSESPRSKRGWATDHDHTTGKVRGILCQKCNRLLGMLGDLLTPVSAYCRAFCVYLGGTL